jgi:hypothetical protein
MSGDAARRVFLQSLSIVATAFTLASIFLVHVGLVGQFHVLPVITTLAGAVVLRYVAVYHQFSRARHRTLALIPPLVVLGISGAIAVDAVYSAVPPGELRHGLGLDVFHGWPRNSRPGAWMAILLGLAGSLTVVGSVVDADLSPYPKPAGVREIARSPVYFGAVCAFFGLWAVLLVGIGLQRVMVIAPVFEELLKFGVALLVGSSLFGRSLVARVGVAIVVGSLFGIIEHATTYPLEADGVYLLRTVFHAATTVLSVVSYTVFERQEETVLQWITPVYSMLIHFFYNTFATLTTVLQVFLFGSDDVTVTLVYGAAAILLTTVLILLPFVSRKAFGAIYTPLEHVLSDVV